jgi:hypothetical protein
MRRFNSLMSKLPVGMTLSPPEYGCRDAARVSLRLQNYKDG